MRWLSDERRFWQVTAAITGVVAALKGLRLPGDWALTEAQIDYSQGFVKRGLPGEIYGRLHLLERMPLTVAFFVELLVLIALLVVWVRRTRLAERFHLPALGAVLAGGYAMTFLFHLIGYPDLLNASLAVTVLLIRNVRLRFMAALPVFALALLIHESFLFLFAPVVLLSFWLDADEEARARRYGLALAGFAGLLTMVLSLRPPLSPTQINALQEAIDARADFDVREDFYQVFSKGLAGNLKDMNQLGFHHYLWWMNQAVGLFVFLPPVLLILYLCRRMLHAGGAGRWTRFAVWIAIGSPLLMHLLGLDCMRWDMWIVVDATLVLGLVCRRWPALRPDAGPAMRHAAILVIALGMASGWGLFDGASVNPYPFFPRVLMDVIERHDGKLPGF